MYVWLFVAVFVVWAWLAGGSLLAWRRRQLGGLLTLGALGAFTGLAGLVILFGGPYWRVVYFVLLQPG